MMIRPLSLLAALAAFVAGVAPLAAQTNGMNAPLGTPAPGTVIRPAPSSEYGRGAAQPYTSPAAPTHPVPPSNPGPVTDYGTGGMQQVPGTAPNPPYTGPAPAPPGH